MLALVLMVASLGCVGQNEDKVQRETPVSTSVSTQVSTPVSTPMYTQENKLPQSLSNYYNKDPIYLINMFDMGGAMMGIIVNVQQNDTDNAKVSFDAFSKLYENTSNMVPEWKGYFDTDVVNGLGTALKSGNPGEIFPAIDKVGKTCSNCHEAEKPTVWAKYHWKDFRTITMVTGNPQEPELPFAAAKMKYLAPAFDGVIVNIKEGQKIEAAEGWNQFNAMFSNLEKSCLQCHSEPPRYFVSSDIKSLISKVGKDITAGNLQEAGDAMQQIGMESCYKCHVIHEPAQRIRESLEK